MISTDAWSSTGGGGGVVPGLHREITRLDLAGAGLRDVFAVRGAVGHHAGFLSFSTINQKKICTARKEENRQKQQPEARKRRQKRHGHRKNIKAGSTQKIAGKGNRQKDGGQQTGTGPEKVGAEARHRTVVRMKMKMMRETGRTTGQKKTTMACPTQSEGRYVERRCRKTKHGEEKGYKATGRAQRN